MQTYTPSAPAATAPPSPAVARLLAAFERAERSAAACRARGMTMSARSAEQRADGFRRALRDLHGIEA